MEKTTTEIENPEVADKMVKLRPSQKTATRRDEISK